MRTRYHRNGALSKQARLTIDGNKATKGEMRRGEEQKRQEQQQAKLTKRTQQEHKKRNAQGHTYKKVPNGQVQAAKSPI